MKIYGVRKCPLETSIGKEECSAAGLSVGGKLQNDMLIEESWNDKPSGCFLTRGDNVIHFNKNTTGASSDNYISMCGEIEVRSCGTTFF